jgi:hypothetical protein
VFTWRWSISATSLAVSIGPIWLAATAAIVVTP